MYFLGLKQAFILFLSLCVCVCVCVCVSVCVCGCVCVFAFVRVWAKYILACFSYCSKTFLLGDFVSNAHQQLFD
jgi:hypothetical protein